MSSNHLEYSFEESVYQALFKLLCRIGRPLGGIRPRRITHRVARKAYARRKPRPSDFRWQRDRWGAWMLLHPYYLIDYEIMAFGTCCSSHGLSLQRFLERQLKPGMVFFDVGANYGSVSLHAGLKVGPSGQVHAFEPVPALVERLRAHVERNRLQEVIRIHPLALSNATGKNAIHCADDGLNNQGLASLMSMNLPNFMTVKIDTITLDDFVRTQNLKRIDLIKVDIEGAEPLFLQGGKQILTSAAAPDLLMEFSPYHLSFFHRNSRDLAEILDSYGYQLFDIQPNGKPRGAIPLREFSPTFWGDLYCRKSGRS